MLQISLIQCIGYSFSLILVVIGPNFLLRKMAFVTSFTKTWFSMWSLVMIAPMFLLGAVTILDVIYPTKNAHIHRSAKLYSGWWDFLSSQ